MISAHRMSKYSCVGPRRTHGRYALNQESSKTQVQEKIVMSHSRDDPKTDFDINHKPRVNFNKIVYI